MVTSNVPIKPITGGPAGNLVLNVTSRTDHEREFYSVRDRIKLYLLSQAGTM
jgi:hypothetical protein